MDFNRIHNYCASLAVSAMLTSAFLATAPEGFMAAAAGPMGATQALQSAMSGLRANDWHGTRGLTVPTVVATAQTTEIPTPPPPAAAPLTKGQIQTLNRILDSKNKDYVMFTAYSRLLGLTKGDETVDVRAMSAKDANNIRHNFGRILNGTGYILTREQSTDEMHMYWVSPDFKLIAAIDKSKANGLTVLAAPVAELEIKEDLVNWAKLADKLAAAPTN